MARKHGVTSTTYTRFVIDSGAVYKNFGEAGETLLGATRGGNSFKIESEQRVMEADGARGRVKGGIRVVNFAASITCNFIELKRDLWPLMLPGVTVADYPATVGKTHDKYTRTADIASTDYVTNIAIVGNSTYSATNYVVVKLFNALSDGNLELAFTDKNEAAPAVTFMAHFDPSTLDTDPFEILCPIIG